VARAAERESAFDTEEVIKTLQEKVRQGGEGQFLQEGGS